MLRHGVDIVEIPRIRAAVDSWGARFLQRIYTRAEIEHCQGRLPSLAARFAAKEAVMKALGTGNIGVSWHDIQVLADENDVPVVHLSGGAESRARELKMSSIAISLSHCREYAMASVIGEIDEDSHG